jgi:purine-cytosine permease-like protein
MNAITAALVVAGIIAGLAVGYWVNPYLDLLFVAAAAIIAFALTMANGRQKFASRRKGRFNYYQLPRGH